MHIQTPDTIEMMNGANPWFHRVILLQGGRLVWGKLVDVRELMFDSVESVALGKMTSHLP